MFSDLALKEKGVSLLPEYSFICIDEAQNIESVAEELFGIDVSNHKAKYLLDGLYNPKTHKGLLAYKLAEAERAVDIVIKAGGEARNLFRRVRDWYEDTKEQTNGRCYANFVDDATGGYLNQLRQELEQMAKRCDDIDEKLEITRFAERCYDLSQDLNDFLYQIRKGHIYWVEIDDTKAGTVRLKSAALNVGGDVKRCLFDRYRSIVMTSATLSSSSAEEEGGFEFFAGRVGLEDFDSLKLGSPFDYEKQVTVYIEANLPEPNEPDFAAAAAEALKKYILQTRGRAFVLFTTTRCFSKWLRWWLAGSRRTISGFFSRGQGLTEGCF